MANHSYVANHCWERHHVDEETTSGERRNTCIVRKHIPFVETRFRHSLFLYCPFPYFHGSDDRLGERLRVLFLHQCLYTLAIDIRR